MAMQLFNRRVTQVTTNLARQLAQPVPMKVEDDHHDDEHTHIPVPKTPTPKTLVSMKKFLLRGNTSITTGLNSTLSIRHAHTDVQVPNFDYYRRKARLDASKSYRDAGDATSPYSYLTPIAMAITSAYMTKYIIRDIAAYVGPAKDVMSLAKVEISLDAVPVGKNAVFEWRNKPIFVRHRTPEEIAREEGVNVGQLRDPQNDSERVQKPEWLIVIGICTHLGCIPIANAGDFGGYYCPCHGSHYDASGRVRKGPAPLNLEVPQYVFKDDSTVVIG
jgi:ubiquinol-cytochrome c reductase iron-sulfur subunit